MKESIEQNPGKTQQPISRSLRKSLHRESNDGKRQKNLEKTHYAQRRLAATKE